MFNGEHLSWLATYEMNQQLEQPPQGAWTKTKFYALIVSLAVLIGTLAQALVVPPAWTWWPVGSPAQEHAVQNSASSVATPSSAPAMGQPNVCGVWRSGTSGKRYNFVCKGQDSFEIYEVSAQGVTKNGSGTLTKESTVEASLLSLPKNRMAYLKLKLSTDGRSMEGSWRGDDLRESGQLVFHRIP